MDDKTLVAIIPSGHAYVRDRALTLNHPPEMGPFNCVGLMVMHQLWQRARPLTRHDLQEAAARWQAHRSL